LEEYKIPVITGPTGVGKTEISHNIAKKYGFEIVSADSRQCYQYMDIGTAKPEEWRRREVRYHLLDILPPEKILSGGEYGRIAREVINRVLKKGKKVMVVGGSGLYIEAIFFPLHELPSSWEIRKKIEEKPLEEIYRYLKKIDPKRAEKIGKRDKKRIIRAVEIYMLTGKKPSEIFRKKREKFLSPLFIGITMKREELYKRIEKRVEKMIENGFVEEVKRLKEMGYEKKLNAFNAVGYREIFDYLEKRITLEEAKKTIIKKTKNFIRRQYAFLKRFKDIQWIENGKDAERRIEEILKMHGII